MIDFDDIDEVATDRAFAGDILDDAALAALPCKEATPGVLDKCLSLRRAASNCVDENDYGSRTGIEESRNASKLKDLKGRSVEVIQQTHIGSPKVPSYDGEHVLPSKQKTTKEIPSNRKSNSGQETAKDVFTNHGECLQNGQGIRAAADLPTCKAKSPVENPWEACPNEVHFKIFKDILPMRFEKEGILPCEVIDIWENHWGVVHARQLKFVAPPNYGKRFLNLREDQLPCSPEVVQIEGKGSILYALTLELTKHDKRLQDQASADAQQRFKNDGGLTSGKPDGVDMEFGCKWEHLRPARNNRLAGAGPLADQVIRIE